MCLDFLDFLETINYPYQEYLVGEEDFSSMLSSKINEFGSSQGVSDSFGFYPIIFLKDKAFSGFDEEVKETILEEIDE